MSLDLIPIRRALISVSDKRHLEALVSTLSAAGVEIISTGGTARYIEDLGVVVTTVERLTEFPEMLDGRVKTLHPAVHGGLLADRSKPQHMQALQTHDIAPIDLLVVNLYPFESALARGEDHAGMIENIDVGGPAMIRAAAKNHASVAVLSAPEDYAELIHALKAEGGLRLEQRAAFAAKAFALTAAYDSMIAMYLSGTCASKAEQFPAHLLGYARAQLLSYGENPHQRACLYRARAGAGGVAHAQLLGGKALSYNNLCDADAAWQLVAAFDQAACVIVKHGNPCGVALGSDAASAFVSARSADPQSAFGGVIAINRALDHAFVSAMSDLFAEVVIAPAYDPDALEVLKAKKKNLRILYQNTPEQPLSIAEFQLKTISGGLLMQSRDREKIDAKHWKTVTQKSFSDAQLADAMFAFDIVRAVSSNAIVIVKNGATIGIGAGQMSRVDAVRIATEHARRHGHDVRGSVLASDAFFPFADNVHLAAEAGIAAIIQPGGSVRDDEVIAAANTHGTAMMFTGTRHFRH